MLTWHYLICNLWGGRYYRLTMYYWHNTLCFLRLSWNWNSLQNKVWMATMQFHFRHYRLISSQGLPISHFYHVCQAVTFLSTFVLLLLLVIQLIFLFPSFLFSLYSFFVQELKFSKHQVLFQCLLFQPVSYILDLSCCVWFLSIINRYWPNGLQNYLDWLSSLLSLLPLVLWTVIAVLRI